MFLLQVAAVTANNITSASSLISFLQTSPFALKVFYFFKIILIIYSFILLVAIILIVASARPKKAVKELKVSIESIIGKDKGEEEAKINVSGWRDIAKLIEAGQESSWRLAVIEADKFFDEVLRRLGYSGETFNERLTQVHPSEIENINDVWNAHRVRNSLSHDVNFKLSEGEAKKAIAAYERAMKDLEVI